MTSESLILLSVFLPLIAALGIALLGRRPDLRDSFMVASSLAVFAAVLGVFLRIEPGEPPWGGPV